MMAMAAHAIRIFAYPTSLRFSGIGHTLYPTAEA